MNILLIVSLLVFVGSLKALTVVVVDNKPLQASNEIRKVAEQVCGATKRGNFQLSRLSSVTKLADFFSQLEDQDSLKSCAERLNGTIKGLIEVTRIGNENVCSEEKLNLIESFHYDKVSTLDSGKRNEEKLPLMLKLFFMHYAMEVSAICRRSLIANLEFDFGKKFFQGDYEFSKQNIRNISRFFGNNEKIREFDDVILVWDLIGTTELELGEPLVKIKDPSAIAAMQAKCSNKYKPAYKELILPLIRLADLGYSWTGERFARELEELRSNKLVRHWYGITQFCEAILPIKFYEDSALSANEIILITSAEAKLLQKRSSEGDEGALFVYEPKTNMLHEDQLDGVSSKEAQDLVKKVKLNVSAKVRKLRRALRRFGDSVKSFAKEQAAKLFLSRKKGDKFERVDLKAKLSEKAFRVVDEKILDQMTIRGGAHREIARQKRVVSKRPKDLVETPDADRRSFADNPLLYMHTMNDDKIKSKILPSKINNPFALMWNLWINLILGCFLLALGVCKGAVFVLKGMKIK